MSNERMTELLLSALDTISQGVILTDGHARDNPIVYSNAGFERLTGYAKEEILGRNCRFLQGRDTDPAAVAAMKEALSKGEPFSAVLRNYRKDGTAFWNELTVRPIEDTKSNRYFVGVQTDVTQRLELEERLRETHKMEALGKLAGGVAHDFNNLLALTLINAELIVDECGDRPAAAEAAGDIISSVEAGSALVRRMLDFARDRAATAADTDLNGLVRDTAALLDRTIREPVRIELDLCDEELVAQVDRTMCEAALINLALNARDAMPGGGRLLFRTRSRSYGLGAGETVAVVTVSDTGCGMGEDDVRRAFDPYFTTKGPERGTGLGLSMVYSFAVQSGGRASIESRVGEGTSVELLLPLVESLQQPSGDGIDSSRILVVEDEPKLRRTVTSLLRRAGYAVDHAASVEEAVELTQPKSEYDLVLSDIRLPGERTGIDLVRQLKSRGDLSGFVLMTGYSDQLEDADDLDGIEVLKKPFRAQALLSAVQSAVSSARRRSGDV